MQTWLKGKRKHYLFWAVFLLYLFSAHSMYIQYLLQDGKPVRTGETLPPTSPDILIKLNDKLELVQASGQDFYELKGFAFNHSEPQRDNRIYIVLHSRTQTLVFPTDAATDSGMIQSYSGYKPGMDQAEFVFKLARDTLAAGTYQLGVMIEDPGRNTRSYAATGSLLKITPNTVDYIPGL